MESHAAHGMYAGLSFDRSLGHRKFGKTTVDCGFLSSKSQWGTLDAKSAGLLRLKLNFHEPAEYKLASAEAHLRFLPSDGGASPEITEHLYPETIYGLPLSQQQSVNYNIEPSFQAMGIGAGGLGWHRAAQRERVHRWLLKGSRLPDKDGLYTNAEWSWQANELNEQTELQRAFQLALVLAHREPRINVMVSISGKLQKGKWRRYKFRYPKDEQRVVKIELSPDNIDLSTIIDVVAAEIARLNNISFLEGLAPDTAPSTGNFTMCDVPTPEAPMGSGHPLDDAIELQAGA